METFQLIFQKATAQYRAIKLQRNCLKEQIQTLFFFVLLFFFVIFVTSN